MWILERKRMRSISSETFLDKPRTSSNESCSSSICSSFDEAVALGFETNVSTSPVEALATSLSQILSDDNLVSPPSFLSQPTLRRTLCSSAKRENFNHITHFQRHFVVTSTRTNQLTRVTYIHSEHFLVSLKRKIKELEYEY